MIEIVNIIFSHQPHDFEFDRLEVIFFFYLPCLKLRVDKVLLFYTSLTLRVMSRAII